jgi:predicted TIM-barrel fold metal-dependent hydrolase
MSNNLAASIGDVSVVDSHVHTWGDGAPPLVYAGANSAPPSDLQGNCGSPDTLLQLMKDANVRGCVIIQPINYLYDHSYLLKVMKDGPGSGRFKFVCLLNPTFSTVQEGDEYLENLSNHGFCG